MEGEGEAAGKGDVPASGPGDHNQGPFSKGEAWSRGRWDRIGMGRTCVGCRDTVEVSKGSEHDGSGVQKAMDERKKPRRWALLGIAEGQGQPQDTPPVNQEAKPEEPPREKGQAGRELRVEQP